MSGTLDVLSVGEGHITLRYDTADEPEAIRAERMISDMLRRGYALLVEVSKGKYERVRNFDRKYHEYIVADFDPASAQAGVLY